MKQQLKLAAILLLSLSALNSNALAQNPDEAGKAGATSRIVPSPRATMKPIYDVVGVYDFTSGANQYGTSFHCSNITDSPVNVQVKVFSQTGAVAGTVLTRSIGGRGTETFSTRNVFLFNDASNVINTGSVIQGRARILAETPTAIECAADMLDAVGNPPAFVAPRRLIRLPRPASGGED